MSWLSAVPPELGDLDGFARFCHLLTLENGRRMELEPFQRQMLGDYFAGFIETLVLLSKKNGKTTLLAALALYHLVTTRDAECVIGATSRDQATILYEQAAGFVSRSEFLQKRLVVKGGYRQIRKRGERGRIRVLAADVDTADGIIPTLALVDELGRHRSAELYAIFRHGLGPRDGQMLSISVAGVSVQSPLGMVRAAAYKLPHLERDGHYLYARSDDNGFALHEWALQPEDDTSDIAVVKEANPASWQTVAKLAQAHDSPSTLPWEWQRFVCGIWTGAEGSWLKPEEWADALSEEERLEPGDRIAIGFDGARYGDATAIVACRIEDGLLALLGLWEAPRGVPVWEIPAGKVERTLADAMEEYAVVRGYFDPPLWQSEIDSWARDFGEPAVTRYPTNRSRFMGAVERFRTDLRAGQISHTGDEDLTRHVLSSQMRETRGGYWLEKGVAGDKIDAAVAAVLAYEARCDAISTNDADRGEYAFL
jgi:phage terminase large subunit-like protein